MADPEYEDGKDKKESDKDILESARKYLKQLIDDDEPERAKMKDDLAFRTLDQWPADIRAERENDIENGPRPCLTIDKINQYRNQIVNDIRQGKPGIVVRPQDDVGDPATAKIIKGLIRNIEDQSKADIAYTVAIGSVADIGLGYIRVVAERVAWDSFDQELLIRPVPDTFSVYLGKHIMPDGSDADRGYVVEAMPLEKFKAEYPKANWKADSFDGLDAYWRTDTTITVVEEYCFKRTAVELLFLSDGRTMTRADYNRLPAEMRPAIQEQRNTVKKQLKWRKLTGAEVLDRRDLPGEFIPIVEVIGNESNINGVRMLWGIVRPAKDSLRMYNYFASTITEKMGLAPKAPFIGAVGQFASQNERWKKANKNNYSFLEYNNVDSTSGNSLPPPQRQGATPMEAALLQQMQVIEHDVQTSLGMFKAATGESESQQSGRAILALQKESDTGTYHFGANFAISVRHLGRVLLGMIPAYYDTKRIIRIIGDDGEVQTAQIDPEQEVSHRKIQDTGGIKNIYNPGLGKYDISTTVGPNYSTQRQEAAATFVEMSKGSADPESASVLRYLVMRNSDSAGAEEGAKLMKTLLPPQALQALSSDQPIPPAVQAQMQQLQQQMQMMQEEGAKLKEENVQLKAGGEVGMAKVNAEHDAKMKTLALDGEVETEKARLARKKADDEIALKRAVAEADYEIQERKCTQENEQATKKLDFERKCRMEEMAKETAGTDEIQAESLAPKLIENMQAIVQEFAVVIQGQQEFQKDLIAQLAKKETKHIAMKMPDGRTASAEVTTH